MASGTRGKNNFLGDLIETFKTRKDDKSPKPPSKPSSKPSQSSPGPSTFPSFPNAEQDPFPTFGSLSISEAPRPPANGGFVGGFHPSLPNAYAPNFNNPPHATSAPSIAMPTPFSSYPQEQSLTMQMALRPPGDPLPPRPRPHSNPGPPGNARPDTLSVPSGSKPQRPSLGKTSSSPSAPTKISKSDSGSTVSSSSPLQKPGQEQCSGVTKAGKRCSRMVKARPALKSFNSDDGESSTIEKYCYQHSKELMGPSGFYSRKNGEWVKFEDWIQPYLQQATQVALRVEMDKARSQSDVYGYIYTFEIRETEESDTIKLKVGRAVNLVKRIDQWGKQCGSKEQVVRGFFPGRVEEGEEAGHGSLMKGRIIAGEKSPWCHRLERLIHLELADLAATSVHLEPGWPKIAESTSPSAIVAAEKSTSPVPCPDCGSKHKEIFEFQRWTRGRHKGKEWEDVVKPVIDRWGKFVELYV